MTEKSKKKVLYIITKSVLGGAGKYVYDLAVNLPKDPSTSSGRAFEVFVAAGGQGPLAQKIKKAGIPYFEIKNFQRDIGFIKEILAYFEILLLLLKIRPDVIHANSSKAGGIAGVAALDYKFLTLNFGVKTIFTAHGWAYHEDRPKWQILTIKLLSIVMGFYYSKIICVSEFDRQSALKNRIASARKLTTIHNGIKIDDYNFLSKEESRINLSKIIISQFPHTLDLTNQILIGTIGEFTKNKGQKYLIEAIKNLQFSPLLYHTLKIGGTPQSGTISNFQCLIIGFGEDKSNLKSQISRLRQDFGGQANLGPEDEIFLIDNLPDAAKYLKAFDIFVLPSLKEGLPYTLLEAGLAELAVIATKVGGVPEIIEDGEEGLLLEPANSEDLAEKIEELINNSEKRKIMAANLRQKILREFPLSKMLNSTITEYE